MNKNDNAYKSISEVAKLLNLVNKKTGRLNTHTIRFWEKEFNQIKPKIFSGRRRYYDNKSIEILKKIHFLLKNQGMTLKGVKKILDTSSSFDLDEHLNDSITIKNKFSLKNKIKNISNLVKQLKNYK